MRCLDVVGVVQEIFQVKLCRCPISGVITDEEWRDHNGLLHRRDEPAIIRRERGSGTITERSWYWRNQLHRADGEPAMLEYAEQSGKLVRRHWLLYGEYSRSNDLPHVEWVDEETGVVVRAEYLLKSSPGKRSLLHRENGPALMFFDRSTGEQTEASFYRSGRKQGVPPRPALKP